MCFGVGKMLHHQRVEAVALIENEGDEQQASEDAHHVLDAFVDGNHDDEGSGDVFYFTFKFLLFLLGCMFSLVSCVVFFRWAKRRKKTLSRA